MSTVPARVEEKEQGPIGVLRSLASDLMSRAGLASQAGLSFGGKRDLYEALGYKRNLEPCDYRSRYERSGIAKRVVEAYPLATWKGGVELIEDEDPEVSTPFEQAFLDLEDRLQIWSTLNRLDVLAGLGRYAILLIGAPGNLESPLPTTLNPDSILYLTPFAEDDAKIRDIDTNSQSERYGQPLSYNLKRLAGKDSISQERVVHFSRILHVADGALDDALYGQPRLRAVWNYLDDLDKVVGGGSEAFWLRVNQGLLFNLDPTLELDTAEAKRLQDSAEELAHGIRRTMATRGMELKTLGSDVANFSNQVDGLISLIGGTTGIPKRILIGSERGELSSTQDRTEWGERVTERRTGFAGPLIVRPLIDLFIDKSVLPEPKDYDVRWPEIAKLNDTERAEIATKWSTLNTSMKETVVTGAEIRDRVLGLDKLELPAGTVDPFSVVVEQPGTQPPPDPNAVAVPDDATDAEIVAAVRHAITERARKKGGGGGGGSSSASSSGGSSTSAAPPPPVPETAA